MVIKKFIAVFLTTISFFLFPSINVNAEEGEWNEVEERSISLFLSIEKNELHIHSDKHWDNISIQMIDSNGRTIYIDVITIPAEEELTIPLSDIPQGNYQVVLTKDNQPVIWYLSK